MNACMTNSIHSTFPRPSLTPFQTDPAVGLSHERFLVDLSGVLSILSESIYSAGPEVFIRELMQNGQDALTAPQLIDPSFVGKMSIHYYKDPEGEVTVMVEDNGVGITLEDARRAFSTIGFSLKRPMDTNPDDSPFVGRFGIGILSGFLVADEITILSRHTNSTGECVHWTGHINGTCKLRPGNGMKSPGTQVFLRLRPTAAIEFTADVILEIARKYGRYLPHPIELHSGGKSHVINDTAPLWNQDLSNANLLAAGREIFDETFQSVFRFECEAAGARGLAFIKSEPCYAGAEASHIVFIKNMLVSERTVDIEPSGAPFLAIIMNADRLRPNAGRDAIMNNDHRLPALRRDIEAALLAHLRKLHHQDPSRLAAIVQHQYRCLGRLATDNSAYLSFLIDHLTVETTLGQMTLSEVFRRHTQVVEFVTDGTDFQRLLAKARSEGDCIVRVETEAAHRLMDLVSKSSNGTKAKRIVSSEYLGRFTSEQNNLSRREQSVLEELKLELVKENCTGAFCEAQEDHEIARLDMGTEESLDRLLSMVGEEGSDTKKLLLNRLHPMVSQMINGASDPPLLRTWIRVLYHIALLEARESPTHAESRRFSRALGNIFTTSTLGTL